MILLTRENDLFRVDRESQHEILNRIHLVFCKKDFSCHQIERSSIFVEMTIYFFKQTSTNSFSCRIISLIDDSRDFFFASSSTFDHIIIYSCTRTSSTQSSQHVRHIWLSRDKLHAYIHRSVATLSDYYFIYFTLFKLVFILALMSHSSLNIVCDNRKCLFSNLSDLRIQNSSCWAECSRSFSRFRLISNSILWICLFVHRDLKFDHQVSSDVWRLRERSCSKTTSSEHFNRIWRFNSI